MRKLLLLIVVAVLLVVSLVTVLYLNQGIFRSGASEPDPSLVPWTNECPQPRGRNISICCYNGDRIYDCTNQPTLSCNEKIVTFIKISGREDPFYLCVNRSFRPISLEMTNFDFQYPDAFFGCILNSTEKGYTLSSIKMSPNTSITFFFDGFVYNTTGERKFIEVLAFPIKDYESADQLLEDASSSRTILEVYKEIVC